MLCYCHFSKVIFLSFQCRLIVNCMSQTRCQAYNWLLTPLIAIVIGVCTMRLGVIEVYLLYAYTIFATAAHLHYGVCVVSILFQDYTWVDQIVTVNQCLWTDITVTIFKYILNEVTLYNLIYVRDTILFVLVCLIFFTLSHFILLGYTTCWPFQHTCFLNKKTWSKITQCKWSFVTWYLGRTIRFIAKELTDT